MSQDDEKDKDPRPRGYKREPFCGGFLGRRRAGKTTTLFRILIDWYKKRFDLIIICTKTLHLQQGMWESIYGQGILIIPLGIDMRVLKKLKDFMETQDKDKEALVIIDDVGLQARVWSDRKQKRDKVTKQELEDELTNLAAAGRHHGISTIYLAQTLNMLPPNYRKQLDWLGVFTATAPEQYMIYTELTSDEFYRDYEAFYNYHRAHTGKIKNEQGEVEEVRIYFIINDDGKFTVWPPHNSNLPQQE